MRAIAHLVEIVLKVKRSSFALEFSVSDFQLKKYFTVFIVGEQGFLSRGRESPFDSVKLNDLLFGVSLLENRSNFRESGSCYRLRETPKRE
ncbi:hypothetical protein, partial [uncultured Nostoc sp.]|uniref:hypothetical protein n=1 Tax=uncultured Nostoc sp. TaxID=340711 RepID=UPI0035C9ED78